MPPDPVLGALVSSDEGSEPASVARRPLLRKLRPGSGPEIALRNPTENSAAESPVSSTPELERVVVVDGDPMGNPGIDTESGDAELQKRAVLTSAQADDSPETRRREEQHPQIQSEMQRREELRNQGGLASSESSRSVERRLPEEEPAVVVRISDQDEPSGLNHKLDEHPTDAKYSGEDGSRRRLTKFETVEVSADAGGDQVVGAAFTKASADSGREVDNQLTSWEFEQLAEAMLARLKKAKLAATEPEEMAKAIARERFVSMALGQTDFAPETMDGLQPEVQLYLQETLRGLQDATDENGNPSVSRRMAQALKSHRAAAIRLSDIANLEVLNLAFCTEVDSFGVVTRFPRYEFRADQEVLLYCELENFVSHPVRGGFETRLQGNYEIVDDQGRRITDQVLPEDSDVCANRRRDFYIAYRLHMPQGVEPGDYQLRLVIEDMHGRKYGQAEMDFQIAP